MRLYAALSLALAKTMIRRERGPDGTVEIHVLEGAGQGPSNSAATALASLVVDDLKLKQVSEKPPQASPSLTVPIKRAGEPKPAELAQVGANGAVAVWTTTATVSTGAQEKQAVTTKAASAEATSKEAQAATTTAASEQAGAATTAAAAKKADATTAAAAEKAETAAASEPADKVATTAAPKKGEAATTAAAAANKAKNATTTAATTTAKEAVTAAEADAQEKKGKEQEREAKEEEKEDEAAQEKEEKEAKATTTAAAATAAGDAATDKTKEQGTQQEEDQEKEKEDKDALKTTEEAKEAKEEEAGERKSKLKSDCGDEPCFWEIDDAALPKESKESRAETEVLKKETHLSASAVNEFIRFWFKTYSSSKHAVDLGNVRLGDLGKVDVIPARWERLMVERSVALTLAFVEELADRASIQILGSAFVPKRADERSAAEQQQRASALEAALEAPVTLSSAELEKLVLAAHDEIHHESAQPSAVEIPLLNQKHEVVSALQEKRFLRQLISMATAVANAAMNSVTLNFADAKFALKVDQAESGDTTVDDGAASLAQTRERAPARGLWQRSQHCDTSLQCPAQALLALGAAATRAPPRSFMQLLRDEPQLAVSQFVDKLFKDHQNAITLGAFKTEVLNKNFEGNFVPEAFELELYKAVLNAVVRSMAALREKLVTEAGSLRLRVVKLDADSKVDKTAAKKSEKEQEQEQAAAEEAAEEKVKEAKEEADEAEEEEATTTAAATQETSTGAATRQAAQEAEVAKEKEVEKKNEEELQDEAAKENEEEEAEQKEEEAAQDQRDAAKTEAEKQSSPADEA